MQTLGYITDHTSQHYVTDAFNSPYITQRGLAVCERNMDKFTVTTEKYCFRLYKPPIVLQK